MVYLWFLLCLVDTWSLPLHLRKFHLHWSSRRRSSDGAIDLNETHDDMNDKIYILWSFLRTHKKNMFIFLGMYDVKHENLHTFC